MFKKFSRAEIMAATRCTIQYKLVPICLSSNFTASVLSLLLLIGFVTFCETDVNVPAGIPQGTKIGPLLFLAMINDLSTTSALWKFADDTTLAEVIPKSSTSTLQNTVDGVLKWTDENVFRLNPTKCKGMQIDFRKKRGASIPLESEGKQFEVVKSAKILGLTVRDDVKFIFFIF